MVKRHVEAKNEARPSPAARPKASSAIYLPTNGDGRAQRRLIAVAAFLAVPTLYVIGTTYWYAWLQMHGLPGNAFPLAVDEALFKGYEAILNVFGLSLGVILPSWIAIIAALIISWLCIAIVLGLWGVIGSLLFSAITPLAKFIVGFLKRHSRIVELAAKAYFIAAVPFVAGGVVLYGLLLLLVPAVIGQYAGEYVGKQSIEKIQKRIQTGKYQASDRFVVLAEDKARRVFLIACGTHGCGVMENDAAYFVTWDHIARIDSKMK